MFAQRLTFLTLSFLLLSGTGGFAEEPAKPKQRGWGDPLLYRDLARAGLKDLQQRESVEMMLAIVQGANIGPNQGWFHPTVSSYDWKWLSSRYDAQGKGTIRRKDFPGPIEWFDRLDRNRDGVLTADDFDFTDKPPAMQPKALAMALQQLLDTDGDGAISKAEWDAFFKEAARGKDSVTPAELQGAMMATYARLQAKGPGGPSPGMLMTGLLLGDIGSLAEGPRVGQRGLDFTLKTHDGKRTISLADFRGKKPVVLAFGNFT